MVTEDNEDKTPKLPSILELLDLLQRAGLKGIVNIPHPGGKEGFVNIALSGDTPPSDAKHVSDKKTITPSRSH